MNTSVRLFLVRLRKGLSLLMRLAFLLFPVIIFIILFWATLWKMSQGRDVLIQVLEDHNRRIVALFALTFFATSVWYTSRLSLYLYKDRYVDDEASLNQLRFHNFRRNVFLHLPRILGFLSFSVFWIAILRLPNIELIEAQPKSAVSIGTLVGFNLSNIPSTVLLLASVLLYFWAFPRFEKLYRKIKHRKDLDYKNRIAFFLLTALVIGVGSYFLNTNMYMVFTVLLQFMFLFALAVRRVNLEKEDVADLKLIKQTCAEYERVIPNRFDSIYNFIHYTFLGIMCWAKMPRNEFFYFTVFNVIAIIATVLYWTTVFNISFAQNVSSLPFVMLALGVFSCASGITTVASLKYSINIYLIVVGILWVIGFFIETHYVRLVQAKNSLQRPDLQTYFYDWIERHKVAIDSADTVNKFPVYFVLANGGASRSGYWTSSVLAKFQDEDSTFKNHLFCLSGASGGSVGNGTFLVGLKKNESTGNKDSLRTITQGFLKTDFLTYTLARGLSTDLAWSAMTLFKDRAGALEEVLEYGGSEDNMLKGEISKPITEFFPRRADLPILCINATRMQDGAPSVVSTVKLGEESKQRIDVLGLFKFDTTLRMSTAIVLGARFPYISPAGRIKQHYFVDGGYFDNSGAGVVHEMIQSLQKIMIADTNPKRRKLYQNLSFNILHIINSKGTGDEENLRIHHPLDNDWFSPLLTLAGSYSKQTTVNDKRLQYYIENQNLGTYKQFNLYGKDRNIDYPMNWTISDYYREKMNGRLKHKDIKLNSNN